jgi:hypothetical protein
MLNEKIDVPLLVTKFPAFYEDARDIAAVVIICHLTLS